MLIEFRDGVAFGRRASAVVWAGSRRAEGLVHNPPDRTGTAATFGAASQTPIDLTGRPHGAFGRNGSDLMVRDDVARTHDHEEDSQFSRPFRRLFVYALIRKRFPSG